MFSKNTIKIACFSALSVAISGCSSSGPSGPEEVAEAYLNAVCSGDVETAKELSHKDYTWHESFPRKVSEASAQCQDTFGGIESITFNESEGDDQKSYRPIINFAGGHVAETSMIVAKVEDGAWRVRRDPTVCKECDPPIPREEIQSFAQEYLTTYCEKGFEATHGMVRDLENFSIYGERPGGQFIFLLKKCRESGTIESVKSRVSGQEVAENGQRYYRTYIEGNHVSPNSSTKMEGDGTFYVYKTDDGYELSSSKG